MAMSCYYSKQQERSSAGRDLATPARICADHGNSMRSACSLWRPRLQIVRLNDSDASGTLGLCGNDLAVITLGFETANEEGSRIDRSNQA